MVYALTYVFGRYNVSLMPTRYIMVGIALGLFIKVIVEGARSVINYEKADVSPSGCRKKDPQTRRPQSFQIGDR